MKNNDKGYIERLLIKVVFDKITYSGLKKLPKWYELMVPLRKKHGSSQICVCLKVRYPGRSCLKSSNAS